MNRRLDDLNVFLEAIRYETEALETLAGQIERSAAYDDAYCSLMDVYARLRNLRTSVLATVIAPRPESAFREYYGAEHVQE